MSVVHIFSMRKYWQIIATDIQRQLTYRIEVYAYRVGNIFEILVQLLLWTALFSHNTIIRGYTYHQMLTYVVIGWFLSYFTFNYQMEDIVSRDIKDGTLSNFLTKPMSYLKYLFARSIGRGSLSIVTAIILQAIIMILLRGKILAPASGLALVIIVFMIALSYINRFFVSALMGTAAFWTTETGGLFTCLRFIINFLSGATLALNLLPTTLATICLSLPFVYFFYFPTQLYLGTITRSAGLIGLVVEIGWSVILFFLLRIVWARGLKTYEGVGI